MPAATAILEAIARGEPQAAARLLPLVYDELRQLAAGAGRSRDDIRKLGGLKACGFGRVGHLARRAQANLRNLLRADTPTLVALGDVSAAPHAMTGTYTVGRTGARKVC